jgi:hypothetical protein
MVLPPIAALGVLVRALVVERRERAATDAAPAPIAPVPTAAVPAAAVPVSFYERLGPLLLLAFGLVWVPLAYFPHSNIPVALPTVRAERFWYLPAVGAAVLIAIALSWVLDHFSWKKGRVAIGIVCAFFGFQALRARVHALDYMDDLAFWRATRRAAPKSAKAHLNYSVMVGARGRLDERLAANAIALELAPKWAMANVYYGDTLCRMHRAAEAWPHYRAGFELAPNDTNLIALGLQCLWDEKQVEPHADQIVEIADAHPGSWLTYLGREIVFNGKENGGVEKKYRPRGYDEGPKQ